MKKLKIENMDLEAAKIDMYGAALMIIKNAKGFLACGYIKIETAEKLGHAGAIVTGVKNFDDMLNAKVCALTSKAAACGVKEGMSGLEALRLLK